MEILNNIQNFIGFQMMPLICNFAPVFTSRFVFRPKIRNLEYGAEMHAACPGQFQWRARNLIGLYIFNCKLLDESTTR